MISYLKTRAALIIGLIGLVVSVGLYIHIQKLNLQLVEKDLSYLNQYEETRSKNAFALSLMKKDLQDATVKYKEAEQAKELASRNANDALNRLRKLSDDLPKRVDTASREAVNQYAVTASSALNSCAKRYYELGERADGYYNAWRLLDESWPTTRIESEKTK